MIVNDLHRLDPAQRPTEVYQRKEFVDALAFPMLTTSQIFDWWRAEGWSAVRTAVLGRPHSGQMSKLSTLR
ncbi:hypothetical protein ACIQFZ_39080 [Streptomyces sp. NPDC093064]|uniref:hypothetical protein n=1 Tax=Streptomyces sp. NPDC093064 TaxID=3366020 RepID=UPI00380C8E44